PASGGALHGSFAVDIAPPGIAAGRLNGPESICVRYWYAVTGKPPLSRGGDQRMVMVPGSGPGIEPMIAGAEGAAAAAGRADTIAALSARTRTAPMRSETCRSDTPSLNPRSPMPRCPLGARPPLPQFRGGRICQPADAWPGRHLILRTLTPPLDKDLTHSSRTRNVMSLPRQFMRFEV